MRICVFALIAVVLIEPGASAQSGASWSGALTDPAGKPVSGAVVKLHAADGNHDYSVTTDANGMFVFGSIAAGSYELSTSSNAKVWTAKAPLDVKDTIALTLSLQLLSAGQELQVVSAASGASTQASGGEHLSGTEVSSLPLNVRDFSKLLLLAAGTMTDTNGAANFTQQFAVNGQRGSATVFAMDGFDTTDAELGGATFSSFNVDAIQEVQSNSGVMPAEIGHGAAGFTNVVTKSGANQIHGSVFEFLRNASLDARNYFDIVANGKRIPPFVRNEFGFTNGGPIVLPGIYNGRNRTYYFGEYQGFRQVLGTTQVIPVPTQDERNGIDTTTFPGDRLTVPLPLNAGIQQVLNGYPLPNEPNGPFGARTYAASSKVVTQIDQFSIRVDHQISSKASLLTRFSLNQVNGPLTNPDQTAINPSFGVKFYDHQRNAGVKYTRTISPRLTSETSLSFIRSTPFFPTTNHTQPAIGFADGLFQAYNLPGGSIFGSYGNVFQFKEDMAFTRGSHAFKWGAEIRVNRDSTIFGTNPNGAYDFGGGAAFSPVLIKSASGTHDIKPGDPLPDSLTGFLTATPYSYGLTAAASDITPVGDKFDEAGVRREAYNFYFQDAWKATPQLTVSYGLRYEVNSRIHEATNRTSGPFFFGADGKSASYEDHTATQKVLINPQPPYNQDWNGWGPRLAMDYGIGKHTVLHAGGSITTLLPNLWQDNFATAAIPYVFSPTIYAQPGFPVTFTNHFVPLNLPTAYNVQGQPIFTTSRTQDVPANTVIDLARFQKDLDTLTPGNVQLLTVVGVAKNFSNGYIASWTAGLDHDFGDFKFSASYVATAGIHMPRVYSPNGYTGASAAFAPFTEFNAAGQAIGGYGSEALMTSGSHSTYHALQTSLTKNSPRYGLGLQASYTYAKSIDDTSAVLGGLFGASGTILQTVPQDPWNPSAEKGPSTFDVTHVFTVSVIQLLPFDHVGMLRPLGRTLTRGWQVLNITTLTTGSPFSVYSGIQQTGAGNGGSDRPDLVSRPHFSTSGAVRDDYFGLGANNASFFNIPINIPGGTGPNSGRFGTLGRDTFRGPDFHDFDFALIKDTPFGHRGSAEFGTLEFRAEFFNLFNIVNFGLPSNIVRGSGFGIISKTAGSSRQIQFSLKVIY